MKIRRGLVLLVLAFWASGFCLGADFTYVEDFTGDDATLPADWTVIEGNAAIQGNVLQTNADDTYITAVYDGVGSEDWANYTFSCDFLQTFTFSGLTSNSSTLYNAILFRYMNEDHYYMVRIRKLAGFGNPTMELAQQAPEGIYTIATAQMSQLLTPNTWFTLTIDVQDTTFDISLEETDYPGTPLASIQAEDSNYFAGSIGFRSIMSSPNYSAFDNVDVDGDTDLNLTCERVMSGFGYTTDLNEDCYVNLIDLAIFANSWLSCNDPEVAGCDAPWL